MTEQREPTDFQKSLVNEATYLRGKILTGYAQVEFLLADISVKLDLKFPYLIEKRIKAAKRLHERPGFEKYKAELEAICDQLVQYDELRNFMAHGYLALTTDKKNNHEFEMRMYRRREGRVRDCHHKNEPAQNEGCRGAYHRLYPTGCRALPSNLSRAAASGT